MSFAMDHAAFAPRFAALLQRITACHDGGDLPALLRESVQMLGFDNGVFATFSRDDEGFDSYRFVLACSAQWCNIYGARRWHVIDPVLIYAANNTEPALLEDVVLRTAGQRELMAAAAMHGFASGIAIPAHTATGRSRMGILYLGKVAPNSVTHAELSGLKMYLRACASELLEWWSRTLRSEVVERVRLTEADRELLTLVHKGYRTDEIARFLSSSRGALDQRLSRLAARFGVVGKKRAAAIAYEQALLSGAPWEGS